MVSPYNTNGQLWFLFVSRFVCPSCVEPQHRLFYTSVERCFDNVFATVVIDVDAMADFNTTEWNKMFGNSIFIPYNDEGEDFPRSCCCYQATKQP